MQYDMQGKIALVTGGSYGIGRAAAEAFAAEGAQVIIASRDPEKGQQAVDQITAGGGKAEWIALDVGDRASIKALFQQIETRYGRLDYAFNNAGTGGMGSDMIHKFDENSWDLTINGYLTSVFLCMKYELALMLPGGGAIVNNSSVDGQRAFPQEPAYSAAKHGVLGLTKSAALQYIRFGIRINAVCPGWIDTPALQPIKESKQLTEEVLKHQPIGRFGQPSEVGDVVVWLCSERASMLVGTAVAVDGGYLAV